MSRTFAAVMYLVVQHGSSGSCNAVMEQGEEVLLSVAVLQVPVPVYLPIKDIHILGHGTTRPHPEVEKSSVEGTGTSAAVENARVEGLLRGHTTPIPGFPRNILVLGSSGEIINRIITTASL